MKNMENKLWNPDKLGTIYYGTDIQYLEEIDYYGMDKPRFRKEQYISISISGYKGILPCAHNELNQLAEIFSKELGVASYEDGYLHYYEGYVNSLTCFQGFGVCPNKYIHTFDGFIENKESIHKVTVVISDKGLNYLTKPDEDNYFEYMSLSLHSFIKEIRQEDIIGYIIDSHNLEQVKKMIQDKKIKNRLIWTEKDFIPKEYSDINSDRYRVLE